MADVNPQDIMKLLQESANSQKSFADKLREQRLARTAELNKFQDQVNTPNDFQAAGGIPLNPADVINAKSLFANSMKSALDPFSPELEQKARGSEADILSQIYQLSQKDQAANAKTAPSYAEKLAALKAGYNINENGDFIKIGTDEASKEMTKNYADLLNAGTIKLTDVPDDMKDAVLKQISEVPKIGKDEVQAVGVIDDILNKNVSGAAGLVHVKGVRPYETQAVRNNLKQLNGILQLASVGKLKGQGAVSDAERAILSSAVSNLGIDENGNTGLSDKQLKEGLKKIQVILAKQSNDPELVARFSGGKSATNYNEDEIIKSVLGGK